MRLGGFGLVFVVIASLAVAGVAPARAASLEQIGAISPPEQTIGAVKNSRDWFRLQRAFPLANIPQGKMAEAQVARQRLLAGERTRGGSPIQGPRGGGSVRPVQPGAPGAAPVTPITPAPWTDWAALGPAPSQAGTNGNWPGEAG